MRPFTLGTKKIPLISVSINLNKRHVDLHRPEDADEQELENKPDDTKRKPSDGAIALVGFALLGLIGFTSLYLGPSPNGPMPSTLIVTRTVHLKLPVGSASESQPCTLVAGGSLSTLNMANVFADQDLIGSQPVRVTYTPASATPTNGECQADYTFAMTGQTLAQFTKDGSKDSDTAAGALGVLTILAIPLGGK